MSFGKYRSVESSSELVSEAQELKFAQILINSAPEAVFCLGENAEFVYVNDVICSISEYSREELLSMMLQEIDLDFSPNDWSEQWEYLKRASSTSKLNQQRFLTYKSRYQTKGGRIFTVEITVNYVQDQGVELICAFVRQKNNESEDLNSKTLAQEENSQRQKYEKLGSPVEFRVKNPDNIHIPNPYFLQVPISSDSTVKSDLTNVNISESLILELDEYQNTDSELAKSLCILRSTLDSAANGILAVNFDGEVLYCNRKFLDMWHLPNSVDISRKCNQAKSFLESQVKDPELFHSCVWSTSSQLERESYDLIELKDGRIFAHYSEPQRLGNKIIGRVWSIWDITESKRTEEALKLSAARFRTLAETTDASIFLIQNGGICYANPAAEVLTGYTLKELVNDFNVDKLFKGKKFRQVHQQDGVTSGEYKEMQVITKNGIMRWLACTVEVLNGVIDFADQPVQLITAIDITDYKNAESDLRQALEQTKRLSELRERFVSMLCHQFRTPLNIVAFSADLLRRHIHQWTEEKNRSYLDIIQVAVKQISELLDEILLFGRAEAAKLKCTPRALDLHQFCRDIVAQVQLASGNERYIDFVSKGNCGNIYLDPKLLQHILINLLSNAIKYSPPASTVSFELSCQDEDTTFKIRDTGIGIPLVDIQQIFEPFYRGSNVDSTPGTGLGLSIVKTLVELHGGEISVESEVGVGTSFTVKFSSTSIESLSLIENL